MKKLCIRALDLLSKYKWLIVLFLIASVYLYLVVRCDLFKNGTSYADALSFGMLMITTLGFVIAYSSYIYDAKAKEDRYKDFLKLYLKHKISGDNLKVDAKVENASGVVQDLDFAFVLICPQEMDVVKAINKLCKYRKIPCQFDDTNSFYELKKHLKVDGMQYGDITLVTLPFLYKENVQIGNEILNASHLFSLREDEKQRFYTIRFFVYPNSNSRKYHRSTTDAVACKQIRLSSIATGYGIGKSKKIKKGKRILSGAKMNFALIG